MTARPYPSTIAHLDALIATGGEGWLVVSELTATGRWRSRSFAPGEVDAAARCAAEIDARGLNAYVRTNLLSRPLDHPGQRGGNADTGAAVALAVDIDVAGPSHKHGGDLPLPPDLATALSIVAELPPPSLTVDTGGGLHLWWMLDEPEHDDPVALVDAWAGRIVEAGRRKGWHVDKPDPSRVLRVCGTHRRKAGIAANRVELVDVAGWPADGLGRRPWCPGGRYGARELIEALPAPPPPAPPQAPARPRRPGEVGPADAVSRLPWSAILEPLGWTYTGMGSMDKTRVELWCRPGEPGSPYSLKCVPDGPAVAWSDACGLPTGREQKLNKWKVYLALHHPGEQAADVARSLRLKAREVARRV